EARGVAGGRLPDAQVVAEEGTAFRNAEKLARNEAVLLVHAREDLGVDFDEGSVERVAAHVAADVPGGVREAVGEARVLREQQEVRSPTVAAGQDEEAGAVFQIGGR